MPREGHGSRNRHVIGHIGGRCRSCPARGMGVEICKLHIFHLSFLSCPARGMGVEMLNACRKSFGVRVMPREGHGSRNLGCRPRWSAVTASCPARGMGVEIERVCSEKLQAIVSCPARGMGVEIDPKNQFEFFFSSCPARGMGVEIWKKMILSISEMVMPREGHGSRNSRCQ